MNIDDTSDDVSERVKVGIGDYAVTTAKGELLTYGLGSCLCIAIYDSEADVAGLTHSKLPSASDGVTGDSSMFTDAGTRKLVSVMEEEGASRSDMIAKLAGGGNILDLSKNGSDIGERNIQKAKETLESLGIPIVEMDVGGEHSRTVYFDGKTGTLTVEIAGQDPKQL